MLRKTLSAVGISALLLCGCTVSTKENYVTNADAFEIASYIAESQKEEYTNIYSFDSDDFWDCLELKNIIEETAIDDGALCYAGGTEVAEIAVIECIDSAVLTEIKEIFEEYIEKRIGDFTGYAPEQAAIVENASVEIKGDYAVLLICSDMSAARDALDDCFDAAFEYRTKDTTETESYTDEDNEDTVQGDYDAAAVIEAYKNNNPDSLNDKNKAIYNEATHIIEEIISDNMNEYEKELAVHDYIIMNCEYDPKAFDDENAPGTDPEHDNPYGVLLHGVGICSGYSSTFQMFMDMIGIECITVEGTSHGGAEHAWNMVCLEDEWYCVDVTWNDPVGGDGHNENHTYFNVTSEFMRASDHVWNEEAVPEAAATRWSWTYHR